MGTIASAFQVVRSVALELDIDPKQVFFFFCLSDLFVWSTVARIGSNFNFEQWLVTVSYNNNMQQNSLFDLGIWLKGIIVFVRNKVYATSSNSLIWE